MKTFSFWLKKVIFRFIGDIKWAGILHPFWFTINAKTFSLKGKHYRLLEPIIEPGDIVIRRFEGYVDKWLIPGYFNHAGIYVGKTNKGNHQVIHAISDGVISNDLIDFMRTDHMVVLRAPEAYRNEAIKAAHNAIDSEYDFSFDFSDSLRFSCTELISHCYLGLIRGKKRFGKMTIVADDIVETSSLTVVWRSN